MTRRSLPEQIDAAARAVIHETIRPAGTPACCDWDSPVPRPGLAYGNRYLGGEDNAAGAYSERSASA